MSKDSKHYKTQQENSYLVFLRHRVKALMLNKYVKDPLLFPPNPSSLSLQQSEKESFRTVSNKNFEIQRPFPRRLHACRINVP